MTDRMLTRRSLSTTALIMTGFALTRPTARSSAQGSGDGDAAIEAATTYSQFENTGNIWPLYQRMHSDARDVVPFYAVDYWYANDFTPRAPELIETTGVEFVDWTWEVTGTTYPGTAEVAYTQSFADGSTVEDLVRLVEEDGEWRWFFGRSRTFVDEQIALAEAAIFPSDPTPAAGWIAGIVDDGQEALDRLPEDYPGDEVATLETGAGDGGDRGRRYVVPREFYVLAAVDYQELSPNQRAVDVIQNRLNQAARGPAFEVLVWDLSAEADVSYATYTAFANEAVGSAVFTVVASDLTGAFWTVTALTGDVLDALGQALAG